MSPLPAFSGKPNLNEAREIVFPAKSVRSEETFNEYTSPFTKDKGDLMTKVLSSGSDDDVETASLPLIINLPGDPAISNTVSEKLTLRVILSSGKTFSIP